MSGAAEKWNRIHARATSPGRVAWVLAEHADQLPESGLALDVACGTGANSLALARHGLQVEAWDISSVAVTQLNRLAAAKGLNIAAEVRDITGADFLPDRYDVIVNLHYLDRQILNAMKASLKPGGLLMFQTFVAGKLADVGPRNPDYLLAAGELKRVMADLETVEYGSGHDLTDVAHPLAGREWIIARRAG